jgi:hypothetical protein
MEQVLTAAQRKRLAQIRVSALSRNRTNMLRNVVGSGLPATVG